MPRSQLAEPSLFPQPKLNAGVPLPAGAVRSAIFTSDRLPPVAQAATAHWAGCPRSTSSCKGSTSTHRLACAAPLAAAFGVPLTAVVGAALAAAFSVPLAAVVGVPLAGVPLAVVVGVLPLAGVVGMPLAVVVGVAMSAVNALA